MAVFDAIILALAIFLAGGSLLKQDWNTAFLYIVIAIYAHDSFKTNRGIKS